MKEDGMITSAERVPTEFRFPRCSVITLFFSNFAPLRLCVGILAFFVITNHFAARVLAQRDLKNIPDPDPEVERKSFQVAEGFEVNLFAADPMLAKPIQMNWDAAGRLWIASSEVYPQIEPGQKANDKILVLEDTDGDGRADKTTVFANGLLIPTGVEPDRVGPNGSSAFVANSTELLHLSDTDGDGKADTSRIVLSGFGTEDTHHILHTFRWGPDGCLYFNQSIYIHSHIETPWGVRRLGGGGIWRFRPESWRLEVLCRGFVNPWGHHFDDWGQSFATDGAYGEGINYVFPGAAFFTAPGASRILKGLNPGSPKHCGLEIVGGSHLPPEWQGNMLTNDFRGNRVCRFVISEDGSGYGSREQPALIKTSHVAFRPIDVKLGPDGAIYIADWYNPIIQHGEVDFRDPRRDHTHGRIWRVTAKGRPLVPRPKLIDSSVDELLDHLKSPEPWTRHFAKRVLKERGAAEVVPALKAWLKRLNRDDANDEHHRLEALMTFQSLDQPNSELLDRLLSADDPRARAAATRVLVNLHPEIPIDAAIDRLGTLVQDKHPRVRLEAVRALSLVQQPQAAELAMMALDQPMDRFLDYALWLTVRELQPQWLRTAREGLRSTEMGFGGNVRHQIFALRAVETPDVVRPLLTLLRAGKVPADEEESVLTTIGALGGPAELSLVLDLAVAADDTSSSRRANLLTALTRASQQRRQLKPEGDLGRLGLLIAKTTEDEAVRVLAVRAAGLWQVRSLRPQLLQLARGAETAPALRQSAMDAIAQFGGLANLETLEQLSGAVNPFAVRAMAVGALTTMQLHTAATRAVEVLAESGNDKDATNIFNRFIQRKDGPKALAAALADRKLTADVAKIGIRLAKISGREQTELIEALAKSGSLSAGPNQLTPDEMQRMVKDVLEHGDAVRGEEVFRRKDLNCLKCHSIAGAGGQAGPDLVSIGASAQIDYLIDSLLDPNKQVKEGFHSLVVATNDGRVLTGLRVRQSDGELVLRDAEHRDVSIPINSIEEQKTAGSIMPAGLTDPITTGELLDLVRFLSVLGKTDGGFVVGTARVARSWEVIELNPQSSQEIRHSGLDALAAGTFKVVWIPAYSNVSGSLPLGELAPLKIPYQGSSITIVRCQIDVTTAGRVKLTLSSRSGLKMWLNETPIEPRGDFDLDLPKGRHTLTVAVNSESRLEVLRCELKDVAGSTAQAQFVTGK